MIEPRGRICGLENGILRWGVLCDDVFGVEVVIIETPCVQIVDRARQNILRFKEYSRVGSSMTPVCSYGKGCGFLCDSLCLIEVVGFWYPLPD